MSPRGAGSGEIVRSLRGVVAALSFVGSSVGFLATSTLGAGNTVTLQLTQSTAFSILGASCGGIQEQIVATGFDAQSALPSADVYLQTRCGGSGRGGGYHSTTYSAWVAASWDFAGTLVSDSVLSAGPSAVDPAATFYDAGSDHLYETLGAVNVAPANCTVTDTTYCTYRAYLDDVAPAAPTIHGVTQFADAALVTWSNDPLSAPSVTSTVVTATPLAGSAPIVTLTFPASALSAVVGPLQPSTTYAITATSVNPAGSSSPSVAVTLTTTAATVAPSRPGKPSALWSAPQSVGDHLVASWSAPFPGNSPLSEYQLTLSASGGASKAPATLVITMSATNVSYSRVLNDTFDWKLKVRAKNAKGWSKWSASYVLSAA